MAFWGAAGAAACAAGLWLLPWLRRNRLERCSRAFHASARNGLTGGCSMPLGRPKPSSVRSPVLHVRNDVAVTGRMCAGVHLSHALRNRHVWVQDLREMFAVMPQHDVIRVISDTSNLAPTPGTLQSSLHKTRRDHIHSTSPGEVDARQHERHAQCACHHAIGEALLRKARPAV